MGMLPEHLREGRPSAGFLSRSARATRSSSVKIASTLSAAAHAAGVSGERVEHDVKTGGRDHATNLFGGEYAP